MIFPEPFGPCFWRNCRLPATPGTNIRIYEYTNTRICQALTERSHTNRINAVGVESLPFLSHI